MLATRSSGSRCLLRAALSDTESCAGGGSRAPSPRAIPCFLAPALCLARGGAPPHQARHASSNSRWKQRQGRDVFAREAKVQGLKSRAAFKLLEMDAKYKLFKRGQMVVDLGYAPGSWSQVAVERTKPTGRVVGIDIIPAQPPKGVATIQGNFLSPGVQALVKQFLADMERRKASPAAAPTGGAGGEGASAEAGDEEEDDEDEDVVVERRPSYIDMERQASQDLAAAAEAEAAAQPGQDGGRLVDIVLSDMSEPWPQTAGFSRKTLSDPYHRMMNTSGISFKDHAGSMDLCEAALEFASDTLRPGGHFVCKFYQGAEDKLLEGKLRKMFAKVHREKPESSRSESKEAYFVALRRKGGVRLQDGESD